MFDRSYTPNDWYWTVNGNSTRFWSSASGAYVTTLPPSVTPTPVPSEKDLTDLLNQYGLTGPSPADLGPLDQAALNAALAAPGSVVRALGLVIFAEINKLRVKDGDPVYTMAQFVTALKAQMR
jgi:hypothetical protein